MQKKRGAKWAIKKFFSVIFFPSLFLSSSQYDLLFPSLNFHTQLLSFFSCTKTHKFVVWKIRVAFPLTYSLIYECNVYAVTSCDEASKIRNSTTCVSPFASTSNENFIATMCEENFSSDDKTIFLENSPVGNFRKLFLIV